MKWTPVSCALASVPSRIGRHHFFPRAFQCFSDTDGGAQQQINPARFDALHIPDVEVGHLSELELRHAFAHTLSPEVVAQLLEPRRAS